MRDRRRIVACFITGLARLQPTPPMHQGAVLSALLVQSFVEGTVLVRYASM